MMRQPHGTLRPHGRGFCGEGCIAPHFALGMSFASNLKSPTAIAKKTQREWIFAQSGGVQSPKRWYTQCTV